MKTKAETALPGIARTRTEHPYFMSNGHYHDHHEIYFLIEGETRYQIGEEVWTLHTGDAILIPRGVLHNTSNLSHSVTERVIVNFGGESFPFGEELLSRFAGRVITPSAKEREELYTLLFKMEKESAGDGLFSRELLAASLSVLLLHLCRAGEREVPSASPVSGDLLPIKRYINEHWREEITLTSLGRRFALNPCYLSRKFRREMGFGLQEYIELVRMMHAEEMLLHSRRTVAEIAEATGFSTPNYFSLVFKRVHGQSPMAYRKAYKKEGKKNRQASACRFFGAGDRD